jgi:tRNA modification GTPase
MNDTIFAPATAAGRAALAVVRISGPEALATLEALGCALPSPREARIRRLKHPVSRETLDEGMVLVLPGPGSFTGEDMVELFLHGGPAVMGGVLEALAATSARPANPGEFTRRAFEHGRLDLTEAEAIADLIDAESAAQRRLALDQLGGSTAKVVTGWRSVLLEALAVLEAAIDFPDEDLPAGLIERVHDPMRKLLAELTAAAADLRGERVRSGFRVAIVGAPNAGKSSVLNGLIGRDAAIVASVRGTTRDIIEQSVELAGYRVVIADTAGLRDCDEQIEAEGVRRARAYAETADLRLWTVDGSRNDGEWREAVELLRPGDILVMNKQDLPSGADAADARDAGDSLELEPVGCSTVEVGGLVELERSLERRVVRELGEGPAPAATRVRHRRLIGEAAGHVERALSQGAREPELMAEDIRMASRALEALTGRIGAEAVLDAVFSSFCIGK